LEQFVNFFYLAPATNIVPDYLTGSLYFCTKDPRQIYQIVQNIGAWF